MFFFYSLLHLNHKTYFFFNIEKNLKFKYLRLERIFIASDVFQNFDVDFWPVQKAGKVLS